MNIKDTKNLYTVGHSSHSIQHFIHLLQCHNIGALVDVRSSPYSRFNPQFNKLRLAEALDGIGIDYHWMGEPLGARRKEPCYHTKGRIDFSKVSLSPIFQLGISELLQIAKTKRVALMCAEKDPLTCHRTFLVARYASEGFSTVDHILADGTIETQAEAESRLLKEEGLNEEDLFTPKEERLKLAIEQRSQAIAYNA